MRRNVFIWLALICVMPITPLHGKAPPAPCLANYSISRDAWGTLPDGLPTPKHIFTSITVCPVAHQHPHEWRTCIVGSLKPGALRRYTPRKIIEALFYAGDIPTAMHLHGGFCMRQEEDTATRYRAAFQGSHEYCTNDCHHTALDFIVTLDKTTAAVSVEYR